MGLTFKENCPDLRNSRVIDVIQELRSYGLHVHVHDPAADPEEARHEYGVELESWEGLPKLAGIVLAVAHREFLERPVDEMVGKLLPSGVVVDVKSILDAGKLRERGINVWRL